MKNPDRYVVIPDDIPLINLETGQPTGKVANFVHWVRHTVLVDDKVGVDYNTLFMAGELRTRFLGKLPGEVVKLIHEEWELMTKIVLKPTKGYNPGGALQVFPHMQAVLDAPTTPPDEVAVAA